MLDPSSGKDGVYRMLTCNTVWIDNFIKWYIFFNAPKKKKE